MNPEFHVRLGFPLVPCQTDSERAKTAICAAPQSTRVNVPELL